MSENQFLVNSLRLKRRGVFGYHARGRREFGSLAAAASEEEQRGRRRAQGRGESRGGRNVPGLLAAGRADETIRWEEVRARRGSQRNPTVSSRK